MENETKAKEFKTAKGRFMAVENPKDAFKTGAKEFEIIGSTEKLTEEQWAEIVDTPEEDRAGYEPGVFGYKTSIHGNFSIFSYTQLGQSLMQSIGCPIVNPYKHLGIEKPKGEVEVSYDSGKTFDNSVEWVEKRVCMIAGIAGGNGYFGEGWATSRNGNTDVGLICDPPDYWVYTEEWLLFEAAEKEIKNYLILKIKE